MSIVDWIYSHFVTSFINKFVTTDTNTNTNTNIWLDKIQQ